MTQLPKRTIGLVVHFFDFRNDVRVLITGLVAQGHRVVVFHQPEDEEAIRRHAPDGVEFRQMREQLPTLKNKLWGQLFYWLGKLPTSRQNFYLMELFKISLQTKGVVRERALSKLSRRMAMPELISYDNYLAQIGGAGKTEIADIDAFVFFTDIYDSAFLARVQRENKLHLVYVYSWDHPCKHTRYTQKAHYLVWNQGMADDLHDLQGIAPSNIEKLGANQFGYIDRYLQTRNEPAFQAKMFPFSYVYFGAAIGIPGLVEQEIEVIKEAASALAEACPTWKLVVRPYPVLREWERYEALKQIDNIVLDDAFRQADRSVSDDMIMQKFRAIEQAEVFLHMGTTLGVEAAYTATPSVIVDYDRFVADKKKKGLALYHFVHQYQNEKYLIAPLGSLRVVSPDDFKRLFAQVRLQGKAAMVAPNLKLRVSFPVAGFGEIAERLSTLVETI